MKDYYVEKWIGPKIIKREDWGFWFSSNPKDWYENKHLKSNRKNKFRYIKKKK